MALIGPAFSIPRSSAYPTFLDLPFKVRERIYGYAGLLRNCPLDLNIWSPEQRKRLKDYLQDPEWSTCTCLNDIHSPGPCDCLLYAESYEPAPIQLLRVSKEIFVETSKLLYSKNRFQISFVFPRALESLRKLNPTSLSQIQHLKVTIYEMHLCVMKPWKASGCCSMKWEQSPLNGGVLKRRRCTWLPSQCVSFFSYLSEHVEELRLNLSLVCDVKTYGLAKRLTDPARRLPVLSKVAIRFNTPADADVETTALHVLAEGLANHLVDKTRLSYQPLPQPKPFRFMDLPTEIQIKILEKTELVVPRRLAWNFLLGFNCDREEDEFYRCKTCQAVRDGNNIDWLKRCPGTLMRRCECWKFPIALFLVNRTMHQLATEVFFSRNHIAIMTIVHWRDHYHRDDACFLLPYLQANALRNLRKITIHILPDLVHCPKEYHLQGLLRQVKGCLQEKATLRRLLLVIVFNLWSNGGLQQIQKQSGEDWQRGKWILNQLRQLRQDGLMDLFVELREENHRRCFEPVEDYETEAFLERYVMGETYNSIERGKRKLLEID